jgi:hypothetical protein
MDLGDSTLQVSVYINIACELNGLREVSPSCSLRIKESMAIQKFP